MHAVTFLQDLAVVMIVAGLVTIIFHRLKQPVVLGYILAGAIIGPSTPPFPLIHDAETIKTLADLGVVLLMFALGMEFSLRKLKAVGASAVLAASLEILLMVWVGYEIGRMFGWRTMDSIFLGAILSISSTTIIVKALNDLGKTKERFAQLVFGILVIEDILGIAMIALLSGIAMTGSLGVAAVARTLGNLSLFLVVVLVIGLIAVPRLIGYVARFKSDEMLLVTVLGLCFGVSLLAVKFGYSPALGAFLIGAIIAETREIHRIETLAAPVRDMFSAIFFVAIGFLIEPKTLVDYWLPILVVTVAVVVGKVVTCSLGAFLGGNDTRTSLRVGTGLAQIGEFSFIIAALGQSLNVTSGFLYPIAVAVSVVTTLLTPYLIQSADGIVHWFDRVAPRGLSRYLDLYTQWFARINGQRHASLGRKLARRWIWQMGLNAALITSIFIGAVFISQRTPGWLTRVGFSQEGLNASLWLTAVLLSLPLFIATFRKLQALGLLIAETRVTKANVGEATAAIRSIVSQVVPIAGIAGLIFYVLVLSAGLLPTGNIFVILLVLVALMSWLLWRSSIRVYAKAQIALEETFAQTPPKKPDHSPNLISPMLHQANLERVTIRPESRAVGKMIREVELRSRTGASIVGIERRSGSIINPGPDEELQVGDEVLLLGSTAQLGAAQEFLKSGDAPAPKGNGSL